MHARANGSAADAMPPPPPRPKRAVPPLAALAKPQQARSDSSVGPNAARPAAMDTDGVEHPDSLAGARDGDHRADAGRDAASAADGDNLDGARVRDGGSSAAGPDGKGGGVQAGALAPEEPYPGDGEGGGAHAAVTAVHREAADLFCAWLAEYKEAAAAAEQVGHSTLEPYPR